MAANEIVKFTSSSANWCVRVKTESIVIPGTNKVMPKSKVVTFTSGEYSTRDEEEIAAIRRSPDFGVRVFENETQDESFVNEIQEAVAEKRARVAAGKETAKAAVREVKASAKGRTPSARLAAAFQS